MKIRVEKQIGAGLMWIETGELAKQAHGSCLMGYDDTVVLCATTTAPSKPGADFFPLTCDYRERVSAAGKFPGGFMKREGRPGLKEILTSRLIDRPIRPLFPKGFYNDVQVFANVLASDQRIDPDVIAMNGCSACLQISPLPFQGPLASVRLGYIDNEFVVFPTVEQLENSELDLVLSGNLESVLMIEGFAREMPEPKMFEALMTAHQYVQEICKLQMELVEKVNPEKMTFEPLKTQPMYDLLMERYYDEFRAAKKTVGKLARAEACDAVKEKARAEVVQEPQEGDTEPNYFTAEYFEVAFGDFVERVVRDIILSRERLDGRGVKEVRPIECRVNVLPRVHGSAIFQRGETQALITVTLGTTKDEQRVEGLFEEYSKRFMLDYNFPPYSVGECKPYRGVGRREYGHGALAERSLKSVLPEPEQFPYTIRVISDILESNGSSSMATVCGATLGLMSAGVPIVNPVAGISIGLVKEEDGRWITITDIMGDEDHYGDMDFKVAGTQNGVTGIQLDLKIDGISRDIIMQTLKQAREARIGILRKMLEAAPRPAEEISQYAPRLLRVTIDPEKIGLLIGPGGKTIRGIQESTGASIEVDNDGNVVVSANDMAAAQAAMDEVAKLTANVEVGKTYQGVVSSVRDFGAFIEILPGRDGLCHVSELSDKYVENVQNFCKVGDQLEVKVIAIDDQNRVKLSRVAVLKERGLTDRDEIEEEQERERPRERNRERERDHDAPRPERRERRRNGDRGHNNY
ncbi:MAG: polyribonucleotide nucleotidyltransferase [Planctomycetia bacterium]|nr:polyribonucleotide nucleotidyltransferase [Planctomycetia bacterium]